MELKSNVSVTSCLVVHRPKQSSGITAELNRCLITQSL